MTDLLFTLVPSQESKSTTPEWKSTEALDLDEYVGVVEGLSSPFSVFVKLSDLQNSKHIRFFTYAAGAKRILLWGMYHVKANQAEIQNACKYGTPGAKLSMIVNYTDNQGFRYAGGATKNRINMLMSQFSGQEPHPTQFPETYRLYKYFLAKLDGKVEEKGDKDLDTWEQVQQEFDKFAAKEGWDQKRLLSEGDKKITQLLEQKFERQAREFVQVYEQTVNLQDYNPSIQMTDTVVMLVNKITDLVKYGRFYKDRVYTELEECPMESTCEFLDENETPLCNLYKFGSDDETLEDLV